MVEFPTLLSAKATIAPYRHSKIYVFCDASIVWLFDIFLSSYRYSYATKITWYIWYETCVQTSLRAEIMCYESVLLCSPIFPHNFVCVCPRSSGHTSLRNTPSFLFSIFLMSSVRGGFPVQSICYNTGDSESFPGSLKS